MVSISTAKSRKKNTKNIDLCKKLKRAAFFVAAAVASKDAVYSI